MAPCPSGINCRSQHPPTFSSLDVTVGPGHSFPRSKDVTCVVPDARSRIDGACGHSQPPRLVRPGSGVIVSLNGPQPAMPQVTFGSVHFVPDPSGIRPAYVCSCVCQRAADAAITSLVLCVRCQVVRSVRPLDMGGGAVGNAVAATALGGGKANGTGRSASQASRAERRVFLDLAMALNWSPRPQSHEYP
jgi:hypothetical protein